MRPVRRLATLLLAGMLVAGCAASVTGSGRASLSRSSSPSSPAASLSTAPSSSSSPPMTIVVVVNGRRIDVTGTPTVAAAARAAGVSVRDGRLLSVVTHRVLAAHAFPAAIEVNGARATLTTALHMGDVVTVVPGRDHVEATRTVTQPVYLTTAAAALYVSYTPGRRQVVEGATSGEVVDSAFTAAPVVGKLRRPASFAFTFDDGPNGSFTQQVLALLAAHHTPAVFCLIGENVLAEPSLAREEAAAGDRLCDHTQTHPLNLPDLPPAQIAAQISDGYRSIVQSDGGIAPVYFRAPGGNWSARIIADARALHLTPLGWTVDPRDWSLPGMQQILLTVLDELRPGGVVLMHDGGGDRSETVAALNTLLPELVASGWVAGYPTWTGP